MFRLTSLLLLGLALSIEAMIIHDDSEVEKSWVAFKKKYNKAYSAAEEPHRRIIFEKHLQFVLQHQLEFMRGEHGYEIDVIETDDLTNEERQLKDGKTGCHLTVGLGDAKSFGLRRLNVSFSKEDALTAPEEKDWRDEGIVSGTIRNQRAMECGGCYGIATVEAIQSHWAIKHEMQKEKSKRTVPLLSIQQVLDCCKDYFAGCKGCEGGNPVLAYNSIYRQGGIDMDKDYPVAEKQGPANKCKFKVAGVKAKITGYGDYEDLKHTYVTQEFMMTSAVGNTGPVVASMCVGKSEKYKRYKNGVFDEKDCFKKCLTKGANGNHGVDHSVTVVGYTKTYWIVKNSQGITWGDKGYIMVKRFESICGISVDMSYPEIE